jgi:hypothetical protein
LVTASSTASSASANPKTEPRFVPIILASPLARLTTWHGTAHTQFASGTAIASFPRGGTIVSTTLDDQTEEIIRSRNVKEKVHILGLYAPRLSSSSFFILHSSYMCAGLQTVDPSIQCDQHARRADRGVR